MYLFAVFAVTIELNATIGTNGWVLGNYRNFGFYRVNYDDDTWQQLHNQLLANHLVSYFLYLHLIKLEAFNMSGCYRNRKFSTEPISF